MAGTEYRPLAQEDRAEALELFKLAYANLQERNNKVDAQILDRQTHAMKSLLEDTSASFWGCYEDDKLVGFAALTQPNAIIHHYLSTSDVKVPANIREVRSIYVYPDRQGEGKGRALIQALLTELESKGEEVFCTDGGYKTSQVFWTELIGSPTKKIENHWGEGEPHMIWIARTERVLDELHDPYRPTENTGY